jgi:probable F420-dependent oxidoreductase
MSSRSLPKGEPSRVKPQLSTTVPTFSADDPGDWSHIVEFARAADAAGFDRLVLSDHVVFGENLEAYADPSIGGSKGGRQPTGPDGAWLEPLVTIAHLTAVTTRVRFGTNILIAALRRPVVLAKMASTIDALSGGRLDLGVGVGWQREEYEAAGLSFGGRGRLLDHSLEVCQVLWNSHVAHYHSDELDFARIHQVPKPTQSGGVPIWVSGTANRRSMDRLARFGRGWIPWGDDAADVVSGIARMRAAMRARDRDPETLQVVGALRPSRTEGGGLDYGGAFADAPRLRDAGVTDFRVPIVVGATDPAERAELFGSIVDEFRTATS